MSFGNCLAFGFLLISPIVFGAATTWSEHALRFTAESPIAREQAIKELRQIKNLDAILEKELIGPQRYLALDVIGALGLYHFTGLLKQLSLTGRSGMTFVTLNSLITSQTRQEFIDYYLEVLGDRKISSASKVVLIDTLARLDVSLPMDLVKEFIEPKESPEVRSAILNYVRTHSKRENSNYYYLNIIESVLQQEPFQLRIQALFLVADLPKEARLRFGAKFNDCLHDPHSEVRRVCRELKSKRML